MALVESFWEAATDATLRQGEYLVNCKVPSLKENPQLEQTESSAIIQVADLIVMTQSCDLEQGKARTVALCPITSLERYETINPELKGKGRWEQVRKGRVEGLYLLNSPTNPTDNREVLVVAFAEIYSLPFNLLVEHAEKLDTRWRLKSPYLEHFSQAFARFFMRVGLPSSIPPYR